MGKIIGVKNSKSDKIKILLELTEKEAQNLRNHTKRVHLFSENLCIHSAKIIQRGAKMGAKYLSIPLSLKSRKKPKISEITYQKIETNSKIFYIATTTKDSNTEQNYT